MKKIQWMSLLAAAFLLVSCASSSPTSTRHTSSSGWGHVDNDSCSDIEKEADCVGSCAWYPPSCQGSYACKQIETQKSCENSGRGCGWDLGSCRGP